MGSAIAMQAAVLDTVGQPLRLREVSLDPPGPGEVRVRVEAAGVCHSDYHYLVGDLQSRLPVIPGHEGCGVVESVGPGVVEPLVGQRVSFLWRPRCGQCRFCLSGRPGLCEAARVLSTSGGLLDGTSRLRLDSGTVHHLLGVSCFAEYAVVSARAVVPVPDDVPADVAAIAGCAVVTGVGAAFNVVREAAGRAVVVFGAGGVGLSAVIGLAVLGANPIVAVDTVADRLELAAALGATATVEAGAGDTAGALAELLPAGADWAIDAVGRPDTLRTAFGCLRPGGTVVAVGLGRHDSDLAVPLNELVQREKRVVGSLYGSANPPLDLARIFAMYTAGQLPLDRLIGRRHPLAAVNDAFDELVGGAAGRAVLRP